MQEDEETRGNFIPLELWKLMDDLHQRGMNSTTIFRAQVTNYSSQIAVFDKRLSKTLSSVSSRFQ